MKTVTDTLGLARSSIAERVKGTRPKRGPQTRDGDLELTAAIRRLVDARPNPGLRRGRLYGYRRIAALIRRERRSDGLAPVNAKRVYRLMKRHGLLLPVTPDAAGRANMTAMSPRCAPRSAGARMAWSSPVGMVRSCASPSHSIAMTAR